MNKDQKETEQRLFDAISGYYDLYPDDPSNEFLNTFIHSWNQLANRIQMASLNNDKLLPVETMNAERKKISHLSSSKDFYESLIGRIEHIVRFLDRLIKDDNVSFVSTLENSKAQYEMCLGSHFLGQYIFNASENLKGVYDSNHSDVAKEINQYITGIESIIRELALTFAKYLGIRKALNHLDHYGELHRYGDVELDVDGLNIFSFNHLTNCSLGELFKLGHDVNTAISIRFLSLNKMQNIPQYDAYCQVEREMQVSGLHTDNFPNESKNLADRARRLQEKRYKELRSFNG